ncbi:DUF488 family protein [Fontivita pretiosa]|uniref:DUF488 domain-containing protein n=1 Tax=Fontivita pretiosa TaxID=2989684 RepID=UPI003D1846FE
MTKAIYTIGHSVHPIEEFIGLLTRHQVTAIADVRSTPYSRFNPQFNRDALATALGHAGIEYVFVGDELGARSKDRACYVDGQVRYDLLATTLPFQRGLDRIEQGAEKHRIALMCAEKDPLACHRGILISRHLVARGLVVHHILEDGSLQSHDEAVNRLLTELGLPDHDLFRSRDELVDEAYRLRAMEIAYTEESRADEQEAPGARQ